MSKQEKKPRLTRRWLEEFKNFATRGSVIDLAVGVIVGAAFGKITSSLVNDIFMPIVGMLFGGVNFDAMEIVLPSFLLSAKEPATLKLGSFISSIVDFFLIALCIFLFIKLINAFRFKKPEEMQEAPPEPAADVALLTEIRDLLKAQGSAESAKR